MNNSHRCLTLLRCGFYLAVLAFLGSGFGIDNWDLRAQATLIPPETTAETTPEVPDFVYDWTAQLIYPAAIRFTLVVDRPLEQINRLSLTITQPQRLNQQYDFDPAEIVSVRDAYSVFEEIWPLDPASPPTLFTEITYAWEIVLDDGERAVVPGEIPFTDDRYEWLAGETAAPVMFVVSEASGRDPDALAQRIRPVYDLLSQQRGTLSPVQFILFFGDDPISPCEADETGRLIVRDPSPQRDAVYPCSPGIMESLFREARLIPLQLRANNLLDLDTAVVAYLVEQAYGSLWQAGGVPEWFQFGMSRFYLPASKAGLLLQARDTFRSGRAYTLTDMSARINDDGRWQAQAYSMVLYIAHRAGVEQLLALANASSEQPFAQRYEQVTGQPLSGLLPNLQNWIFTSQAEADFGYTPYLPVTPTPTLSLTPTPFPPTASFTPSATTTSTPTPTVTGVLSPTPLPTLTPTATHTRAPRTPTPRPFSSLFTATPIPPVVLPGEGGNTISAQWLTLGVIGIFAALGLLVIFAVTAKPRPSTRNTTDPK